MFHKLIKFREILSGWLRAAQNNTESAKRARRLPGWLASGVVLFDFFVIGLWFHYTREMSFVWWAIAAVILYLVRISVVTASL